MRYFKPWWVYAWWYRIGFYLMGATFKVAQYMAASTFGRDTIFSFYQPGHDLKKSYRKKVSGKTKFIKKMPKTTKKAICDQRYHTWQSACPSQTQSFVIHKPISHMKNFSGLHFSGLFINNNGALKLILFFILKHNYNSFHYSLH